MPTDKTKSRTRRNLLNRLKMGGPADASSLAEPLGITAMAVRQHLYDLLAEGLVESHEDPRPIGRPAKLWGLTQTADRHFPDAHADLAVDLIDSLRAALGDEAMDKVVAERSKRQTDAYRSVLMTKRGLPQKLKALAKLRTEEGYMAAVEKTENGYLLVENHCPVCSATRACTGLCAMELQVFADALGPKFEIERTDHILAGARRCAYRVKRVNCS